MGSISVTLPTDGTTADVSDYNTPITTIVTAINGNIDNANVKSGAAIDPAKIAGGSSAMLSAWQSWTPTWTNLVVTGSTVTGRYCQVGKLVTFRLSIVLGGGNTPTGSVKFSLPVTAATYPGAVNAAVIGNGIIVDTGVSSYTAILLIDSTTVAAPYHLIVNANYATHQNVGNGGNTPFTMGNGDEMHFASTYEAA